MHIVFLTSEYPKQGFPHGGVGTVIQTIARGLVKHKHKVSVIGLNYTTDDEIEDDHGVLIYRYKPRKLKFLTWHLNFKTINKAIYDLHKNEPVDVIESTELSLAFIRKIKGIKHLIRMHGGHHFFAESEQRKINWWKGFQEKRSFKKADHVIGVSQYVVDHTAKYIDFKDKFEGVVYNLANLERFKPKDNVNLINGRVFFAGSLCEKKGVRQLIQAMPKVTSKIPEAHLVVAGRDTQIKETGTSYLDYLKSVIPSKIKNKITFLGSIENEKLAEEIHKSEVCVYPSHMEAMPLAWLEVLSSGKAFIGSNLGPGPEVVNHKETGLLCNPFDIEQLANAIIMLLQNKAFALKLGQNATIDVNKRFGYDTLVHENIELYNRLKTN